MTVVDSTPLNLIWGYEYHPDGSLAAVRFPNSFENRIFDPDNMDATDSTPDRRYYYDGLGRLVMIEYPNVKHGPYSTGSYEFNRGYEYYDFNIEQPDLIENVYGRRMGNKTRQYTYDDYDRLQYVHKYVETVQHNVASSPTVDYLSINGSPSSTVTLELTYDDQNRVTGIRGPHNNAQ